MKNKKLSGVSVKITGIVSAAIYAVLVILRIYHTFFLTDAKTGFFTEHNFSTALMYILAIGFVPVVIILCFLCANLPSGELKIKNRYVYAFSSAYLGGTLLIEAYSAVKKVLSAENTEFALIKEELGGTIGIVSTVFAILGGLTLFYVAACVLLKKSIDGKNKILMLFPVIWAFTKTLGFFTITVSYLRVAQLLISIFAAAFFMLFLFENARVTTGIGREKAVWFFYATGLIAAGLMLSAGIPAFAASLFNPEKTISYCPFETYTLSGTVYVIVNLFCHERIKD